MKRRDFLKYGAAGLLLPTAFQSFSQSNPSGLEAVDLLIVFAVDISGSVDIEEARLQRQGHVKAIQESRIVEAIQSGPLEAIACTYIEWADANLQRVVVPWMKVSDVASSKAFADRLDAEPIASGIGTSISAAIDYSVELLERSPFQATRRVIDISGDGGNNAGGSLEEARERAVEEGITINGLPILQGEHKVLEHYFREYVIGGPKAFIMPSEGFEDFENAIYRKMVREIAWQSNKLGIFA